MTIKELLEKSNTTAELKGFWESYNKIEAQLKQSTAFPDCLDEPMLNWIKEQHIATKIALCITELSECIEARRKSKIMTPEVMTAFKSNCPKDSYIAGDSTFLTAFEKNIKDTDADELADTFIRLGDLCKKLGIDIEFHIAAKMKYNEQRAKMHGKKY